jgi:uncharacterized protein (DUF1800 family)
MEPDASETQPPTRTTRPDGPPAAPGRPSVFGPGGRAAGGLRRAALAGAGLAALRAAIAGATESRSGTQASLVSERDRIAHLLRRAGFGYSAADLDAYTKLGLKGTQDALIEYESVAEDVDDRLQRASLDLTKAADLQRWWLLRMVYTKRPLQEKMVLFWHGLLTSATSKVGLPRPKPDDPNPPNLMLDQNQFFRANALADLGTILKGISRDPAMMVWLDAQTNTKGKPNENFARELMELFTLGLSGPDGTPTYTEQDVREVARAFTGWGLNGQRQFVFRPNQHDGGAKTVFGQTGAWNGDDVIDLIMAHPANATYLSRRLFSFFAYDDPEPEALAPVVDTFRSTKGSVKAVVRAILTSPAFYSPRAYRARPKAPAELVAGLARALQLETDALTLQTGLQRMGQTLFNPPNVAGWPGGAVWFNTSTWLERVNEANRILSIRKDDHTQPVDLLGFMQHNGLTSADSAVDYFLGLLVDGQVRPEQRQALLDYAKEGNLWTAGQPRNAADPAVDRKLRGLVYLIASSAEYQLA